MKKTKAREIATREGSAAFAELIRVSGVVSPALLLRPLSFRQGRLDL